MGGGKRLSDDLPSESSVVMDDSSSSSSYSEPSSVLSNRTYLDLLRSYENPPERIQTLQHYKDAILRHKPGDWIEGVGGLKPSDYDIPEVTTLLLVGPRGSGKSSLINRITRVFEEDKFAPDRAQVSHNLSVTSGTCFLQEYMIPRNSNTLCVYDSRSFSTCTYENIPMLCSWMTQGVSHGQMVIRDSDSAIMRTRIRNMARHHQICPCQKRIVNFVIFVVDGISVLKSMDGKDAEYNEMLVANFNYPHLSFRDNKPAIVVTHGDELSFHDRARVRAHLGENLGIPPKQIFDIPDSSDHSMELAIVDMLRYSIEHADRNLPYNGNCMLQARRMLRRKMDKFHFDDWAILSECLVISMCLFIIIIRLSATWLIKT